MKQLEMDGDVLCLPQEIIRNILKRLPVKSLIRFQCACKDWKNLIKDPSFIADHLQQSSYQNPSLLSEFHTINLPSHWRLHLLDCGLQVREVPKSPLINSSEGACIIGSCNGLLLVEIHHYNKYPPSLSLWNPATTAVKHVPVARTDCFDFHNYVTGFGFSPIVNEYKIVRIYEAYGGVKRVEVFSLSRGSWTGIDIGNLKGVSLNYGNENVMANGAIFWTGIKLGAEEEGEDYVEVIVSFDIAQEVFTLISRPDLDYDAFPKVTVYENKLAIFCNTWEDDDKTIKLIDLWVLDNGTCASGEIWSWTKRYTNIPFLWELDLVTIWRNEIVCEPFPGFDYEEERHVLYLRNVTTDEVRWFVIPYRGTIHSIYDYVESLVSVGNNYIEES